MAIVSYRNLRYLLLIPLVTVALFFAVSLIPKDPRAFLSGGILLGEEPEAWIGDRPGRRVAGKGKKERPPLLDVDFIKVKGRWYKIKGPIYITKGGKIMGWHRETTLEETGYQRKQFFH